MVEGKDTDSWLVVVELVWATHNLPSGRIDSETWTGSQNLPPSKDKCNNIEFYEVLCKTVFNLKEQIYSLNCIIYLSKYNNLVVW